MTYVDLHDELIIISRPKTDLFSFVVRDYICVLKDIMGCVFTLKYSESDSSARKNNNMTLYELYPLVPFSGILLIHDISRGHYEFCIDFRTGLGGGGGGVNPEQDG